MIVARGFEPPDVEERLRSLAEHYGIEYEALKNETGEFVWNRHDHDPYVHFATNPRLASSYARRGSEIDHFGRQAIYRLRHPTPDRNKRAWERAAEEWAKAEVTRTRRPAVVEIAVPRDELPSEMLERIARAETKPLEIQRVFLGEEILLSAVSASKWIVGMCVLLILVLAGGTAAHAPSVVTGDSRPAGGTGRSNKRKDRRSETRRTSATTSLSPKDDKTTRRPTGLDDASGWQRRFLYSSGTRLPT